MKKSLVLTTAILLACILAISGCVAGGTAASASAPASSAAQSAAAASETANAPASASAAQSASAPASAEASNIGTVQGNTVTDMLGNKVTFSATNKIVSLAPSATEILYALGLGDKIIGVDSASNYPADVKSKEVVGDFNGPNVEKIVALKPDIVFCGNTLQKDQIAQMQQLGLTVVATEAVAFDDVPTSIEMMGAILGKDTEAKAIVAKIDAAVADAKKNAPKEQRTMYYVMSFGDAGNWTSGPGSFINTIIETCGGVPVTKDAQSAWLEYPMESLVKADPSIIMLASDAGSLDDLKKAQGYKDLTAVKDGKVYAVDADILSRPGPRIADALAMVSGLLNK